jgi:UDPglucose 6-dehydrogenase
MANIGVIGLGYVGITTAVGMAQLGHRVLGYDVSADRAKTLAAGIAPIHEAGLEEALNELLEKGNLEFTDSINHLGPFEAEFFFVCVPTPQDASGAANLSYVLASAEELSKIAPANSIVVLKSTVPVGSGKRVIEAINRSDVFVASNPEFLREGSALNDFMNPDRIVAGAATGEISSRVLNLYSQISTKKVATSIESAELVKYSSNAYLAMRLSFVNDLALLCDRVGASIDDVVSGLGSDSRIGPSFLSPGPGWGGSCFPKDTRALVSVASDFRVELPLVEASLRSNEASLARAVDEIRDLCGGVLEGKTVAVWGLAFKAGTDDTRDSPAVDIIKRLLDRGSIIQVFDPVAASPSLPGLLQKATALEAAVGADVLAVLTEWPEFAEQDPTVIFSAMKTPAVFDARRILPADSWAHHSSTFKVLGGQSV